MYKTNIFSRQGFANILLIVLVVALAGALGYVTWVKKPGTEIVATLTPTNSPSSTISQSATTSHFSWNGVGFAYPNTWEAHVVTYRNAAEVAEGKPANEIGFTVYKKGTKLGSGDPQFNIGVSNQQGPSNCKEAIQLGWKLTKCTEVPQWGVLSTVSSNQETIDVFDQIIRTMKNENSIVQLTKEKVLNGFDQCGNQFKNGVFEAQLKTAEDNAKWNFGEDKYCYPYSGLETDQLTFTDLDGDGINEVLVPARIVFASSGGVLYVFKNVNGVARVINTIGFGKENATVVSVNKDIVVVQTDGAMGYMPKKETYKFVNGKLIKQ